MSNTIDRETFAHALSRSGLDEETQVALAETYMALTRENAALRRLRDVVKRLDGTTGSREVALDRVERVQKHADTTDRWTPQHEDAVLDAVAKGVEDGGLHRTDVMDAMFDVASRNHGSVRKQGDRIDAYAKWRQAGGSLVEQFHEVYHSAPFPSEVEPEQEVAKRDDDQPDSISKRAARRFPDLDEPEAVTAYLDTSEGQQHYGRTLDR